MNRKPAMSAVSMRRALTDPVLLGAVLAGDSWLSWRALLIANNGEALIDEERAAFTRLTGRSGEPLERCEELWVVARRGGKSRAAAVLAIYQAVFVDHSADIVIGERPVALCLAKDQKQANIVYSYICGIVEATPMLANLVKNKTADALSLSNTKSHGV